MIPISLLGSCFTEDSFIRIWRVYLSTISTSAEAERFELSHQLPDGQFSKLLVLATHPRSLF